MVEPEPRFCGAGSCYSAAAWKILSENRNIIRNCQNRLDIKKLVNPVKPGLWYLLVDHGNLSRIWRGVACAIQNEVSETPNLTLVDLGHFMHLYATFTFWVARIRCGVQALRSFHEIKDAEFTQRLLCRGTHWGPCQNNGGVATPATDNSYFQQQDHPYSNQVKQSKDQPFHRCLKILRAMVKTWEME